MKVKQIIEMIKEMQEDSTVPKNTKLKLEEIAKLLNSSDDISLGVSKSLSILEELSEDANMPQFVRTQVLNLATMLEMI